MNESLLHYVWKFRLFDQNELKTSDGEPVEIIHQGNHNLDAGADFQNARIRIGKTLWAGNVEIHINSDDWTNHHHQKDKAYNNVILHVAYQNGKKPIVRNDGTRVPLIELEGKVDKRTLLRYEEISKRKNWVPCAKYFKDADEFVVKNFEDRLLVERLEGKVKHINTLLAESENDWENVMFQMLAKYLGASVNKEPFEMIAKSLPVKTWAKHQHDRLQTEALVFGQAGFLDEVFIDEYPNQLRKEYNYLKRLYQLTPQHKHQMKFLRLRPSNFPTIRLAQLAALMGREVKLFSEIIAAKNVKAIHQIFDVEVSEYWKSHYRFDKPSAKVNSHLGTEMKNILLINAVAPVVFAYGKYKAQENYCDKAFKLLESCKSESNTIIKGWQKLGLKPTNAFETQALLQMKNEYCDKFRCLQCAVGHQVLR